MSDHLPPSGVEGLSSKDLRLTLLANGYTPLPIRDALADEAHAGKRPVVDNWASIAVTPALIGEWDGREIARHGTGLRMSDGLCAFDIDVNLDAPTATEIVRLAREHLGAERPLIRIGREPRCTLFYRAASPIDFDPVYFGSASADVLKPGVMHQDSVALLSEGQQSVAFGIHPDIKKLYRWIADRSPLTVPLSALPVVTQSQVDAFRAAIRQTVETSTDHRDRALSGAGDSSSIVRNADGKVIDGRDTLMRDLVWSRVKKMYAAIERAPSPDEREILISKVWEDFTNEVAGLDRNKGSWSIKDVRRKVRSTLNGSAYQDAVYHTNFGRMMVAGGMFGPNDPNSLAWKAARALEPVAPPIRPRNVLTHLDEILSGTAATHTAEELKPRMEFEPPLAGTPSRALYDAILRTMHYPNTTIAWVATAMVQASILQRVVFVDNGIGVSQFMYALGTTGEGKAAVNESLSYTREVLKKTGDSKFHFMMASIGGDFSHPSGLLDALEKYPVRTSVVDEGGYLIDGSQGADSNKRAAAEAMLKIRTYANLRGGGQYQGEHYSKAGARGKDRLPITTPALSVAADTQAQFLYPRMTVEGAKRGQFNRWFIADASRMKRGDRNPLGNSSWPDDVCRDIVNVAAACIRSHVLDSVPENRFTVRLTRGAYVMVEAYEKNFINKLSSETEIEDMRRALFTRAPVVAKSIAGLHAAWDALATATYSPDHAATVDLDEARMRWALDAVHKERSDTFKQYEMGTIGGDDAARKRIIIEYCHKYFESSHSRIREELRAANVIPMWWFTTRVAELAPFNKDSRFSSDILIQRTLTALVYDGVLIDVTDVAAFKIGQRSGKLWQYVDH